MDSTPRRACLPVRRAVSLTAVPQEKRFPPAHGTGTTHQLVAMGNLRYSLGHCSWRGLRFVMPPPLTETREVRQG